MNERKSIKMLQELANLEVTLLGDENPKPRHLASASAAFETCL
jgi:hypothetical protein